MRYTPCDENPNVPTVGVAQASRVKFLNSTGLSLFRFGHCRSNYVGVRLVKERFKREDIGDSGKANGTTTAGRTISNFIERDPCRKGKGFLPREIR